MKKMTTTDKAVYEFALSNLETIECTNINITPGVSIVYSYEVPEPVKVATKKVKK